MAVASEEDLRAISKQFGAIIPKEEPIQEDDIQQLKDTLAWLFRAAEFPQLTSDHRSAACNALCGFVDTVSGSSILQIRSVVLDSAYWSRLLFFYFNRYHDASTRIMKQFRSTLINVIRAHQQDTQLKTSKWAEDVGKICARSISSYSDPSSLKPSMLLLEELLSKQLLLQDQLIDLYAAASPDLLSLSVAEDHVLHQKQRSAELVLHQVVADVLRWSRSTDITSIACRLLKTIFTGDQNEKSRAADLKLADSITKPIWLSPILTMAKDNFADVEKLEKRILPQLLAIDERNLVYLVTQLPFRQLLNGASRDIPEVDIRFSILLLSIMRTINLSPTTINHIELSTLVPFSELQEKFTHSCLQHQSPYIRVSATTLIVTANGTTQPFSEPNLLLFRPVLKSLFVESDAKVRGETTDVLKRLTGRLRLVVNKLKRTSESGAVTDIAGQNSLAQHEAFVSWFHGFLCEGLRPSASYQRRVSSLKVLNMETTLALFSTCEIDFFTCTMIYQLADLVLDTFDDIRSLSAALLVRVVSCNGSLFDPALPTSFVSTAKARMIATGRASISDGYARFMELSCHRVEQQAGQESLQCHTAQILLGDINQGLAIARSSFVEAVKRPQLHGHFSALRFILMNTKALHLFGDEQDWLLFKDQLIDCCDSAWETVKPILCIDSPEGQGDEDDMQGADLGIKDTLSYSWRTLKEASALLQALVDSAQLHSLSLRDIKKIGDLCFVQLSELRHRGAFSAVAQCFTSCCARNGCQVDGGGHALVEGWYRQLLVLIDEQSTTLTRRSAGLPAMITAILSADVDKSFLDMTFKDLQSIASRGTSTEHQHGKTGLPQVHAMNCLRTIFASSRLSHIAEIYLGDVLQIAVQSLDHDIWSIRNCAGMLLRAILSRLSNTIGIIPQDHLGDNNITKKFYRKYPSLANTVKSLLQASVSPASTSTDSQTNRQVNNGFPALAIIDQVGLQEDEIEINQALLFRLLNSPVWLIRERAAHTISRLIDLSTILEAVQGILDLHTQNGVLQTNGLHGWMFCLKASLEQFPSKTSGSILVDLLNSSEKFISLPCPFISAIYFDILYILLERSLFSSPTSDADINPKDVEGLLQDLRIGLERFAGKEETVYMARQRLQALLYIQYSSITVGNQANASSLEINKDNAVLIARILNEQHNGPPKDWERWLPGLLVVSAGAIEEDPESPSTQQVMEELTILLSKPDVIAYIKGEQAKTTGSDSGMMCMQSTERLLSECEASVHMGRTVSQVALELGGVLLSMSRRSTIFESHCSQWIRGIRCAISDEMNTPRRFSAVKALDHAKCIVKEYLCSTISAHREPEVSMLVGMLFDGLVDDDDDIRILTAQLVSHVLFIDKDQTRYPPSLSSPAAQDVLLQYTKTRAAGPSALFSEILARSTGLEVSYRSFSMAVHPDTQSNSEEGIAKPPETVLLSISKHHAGPIADIVQKALAEDNVLFEVERQNLYKDNVQQMHLWADILISTPFRSVAVFNHPEAQHSTIEPSTLCNWAVSGLETIVHSSGPAGWNNRLKGFEAVCQALIFAQIVQSWHPPLSCLVRLRSVLLAAESHIYPAHGEHTKIINFLRLRFEEMSWIESVEGRNSIDNA